MKIVYCISTKQHGGMKSASCSPKAQPFQKRCVQVRCLAGRCKSQAIPISAKLIILGIFPCSFNSLSTAKQMKTSIEAG